MKKLMMILLIVVLVIGSVVSFADIEGSYISEKSSLYQIDTEIYLLNKDIGRAQDTVYSLEADGSYPEKLQEKKKELAALKKTLAEVTAFRKTRMENGTTEEVVYDKNTIQVGYLKGYLELKDDWGREMLESRKTNLKEILDLLNIKKQEAISEGLKGVEQEIDAKIIAVEQAIENYNKALQNPKIDDKNMREIGSYTRDMAVNKRREEILSKIEPEKLLKFKKIQDKLRDELPAEDTVLEIDSVLSLYNDFNFDTPPIIKSGRTLVPIRAISEAYGAEVTWDGITNTVGILKDGKQIELPIGEKIAYVDGKKLQLDTKAELINSRTYVPLRFVSESLGLTVHWEERTQTVLISD